MGKRNSGATLGRLVGGLRRGQRCQQQGGEERGGGFHGCSLFHACSLLRFNAVHFPEIQLRAAGGAAFAEEVEAVGPQQLRGLGIFD